MKAATKLVWTQTGPGSVALSESSMPNLEEMSRVLYNHHWETIEDWVENIGRLADLTDPEINEVTRLGIELYGAP